MNASTFKKFIEMAKELDLTKDNVYDDDVICKEKVVAYVKQLAEDSSLCKQYLEFLENLPIKNGTAVIYGKKDFLVKTTHFKFSKDPVTVDKYTLIDSDGKSRDVSANKVLKITDASRVLHGEK